MKKTLLLFVALSMFIQKIDAQCFCPNVATGLVANGDFSQGNTGFTTVYSYSSYAAPGSYGIRTNSANNNSASWSACSDHTTGSGNFMWVDADAATADN